MHFRTISPGTLLLAVFAFTFHCLASPTGAELSASLLRHAFDVFTRASKAVLIAFFIIQASALQIISTEYAFFAQRFALTMMSVVALRVQKIRDFVADLVEDAITPRTLVETRLRRAVENTVSLLAHLSAGLGVPGAMKVATAARTLLSTVVGAARERAIRAAVLLAHV